MSQWWCVENIVNGAHGFPESNSRFTPAPSKPNNSFTKLVDLVVSEILLARAVLNLVGHAGIAETKYPIETVQLYIYIISIISICINI